MSPAYEKNFARRCEEAARAMDQVNPWQQQALTHWPLINRLANRRFPRAELAEEAALSVLDELARDDWRRLQAFAGRSTLATYIAALTLRLLEDFARTRFGRIKPPGWIRRLGGIWLTLFRLLCLERLSPAEAVHLIGNRQPGQERVVEETAYRILGEIPSCGELRGTEVELDEATAAPDTDQECSLQEQRLQLQERHELFTLLGRIVFDEKAEGGDPRLLERLAAVDLGLAPEERLLLKLCYRDGVAVAEAGRMLGWNRFQTHGRLRRLLQRLRQQFTAAGLAEELHLLL